MLWSWRRILGTGLLVVALAAPAAAQPEQQTTDAQPARAIGRCVAMLVERARLEKDYQSIIEPLWLGRNTLNTTLAILSLPTPSAGQARQLELETREHEQEIEKLHRVLEGKEPATQAYPTRTAITQRIALLHRTCSQNQLFAKAHAAEGGKRIALLEETRAQVQTLSDRIQTIETHYQQRQNGLKQHNLLFNESFQDALYPYAHLAELGTVNVQAVRIHGSINDGRLTLSWTDAKGSIVASAMLKLRARPDDDDQPPLVMDRYPILLQARQEVQISAGYFLIEFRVGVDELAGESRVLDCATRLLDIDALGRMIPRLGSNGLN